MTEFMKFMKEVFDPNHVNRQKYGFEIFKYKWITFVCHVYLIAQLIDGKNIDEFDAQLAIHHHAFPFQFFQLQLATANIRQH